MFCMYRDSIILYQYTILEKGMSEMAPSWSLDKILTLWRMM